MEIAAFVAYGNLMSLLDAPGDPLSEDEEAIVRELLEASGSVPLPHARGVFSALACEPGQSDPTSWLPMLLSSEVPNKSTLDELFALMMRDRAAIRECFALGQPYAPHPEDHRAMTQFCKGFVRLVRGSEAWQNDTEALELVMPLAVLAGYLPFQSFVEVSRGSARDEAEWASETRRRLPELLLRSYEHFAELRQKHVERFSGKVGRNEPCPCGSGKKYKRCCGAAS